MYSAHQSQFSVWFLFVVYPLHRVFFRSGEDMVAMPWRYNEDASQRWISEWLALTVGVWTPKDLGGGRDEFGVLLDLGGNAHVDVLVADGHDQASDKGGIDLGGQLNGLLGLDEFLKTEHKTLIKMNWPLIISKYVHLP